MNTERSDLSCQPPGVHGSRTISPRYAPCEISGMTNIEALSQSRHATPRLGPPGEMRSRSSMRQRNGRGVARHCRPVGGAGLQSRYMLLSILSCRMSAEISTAFSLPVFFHQCAVVCVSGATSPALCTIGTAQVLAYSVTSPDTI